MNKNQAKKARQKRMKLSRSKPTQYTVTQSDTDTLKMKSDQLLIEEASNLVMKNYVIALERSFNMGMMHE